VVVVLLLTFLVTSADSGILIINTLASGGSQSQKGTRHIIVWGVIFTFLIGSLLGAGGMDALRSAMIVGALPFSVVMALMTVAMLRALITDSQRPRSESS
ncbi:MAG: BCCT family transporter, partial [Gammaproteobacteria bacterium]